MVLNYIWISFFLISFIVAIIRTLLGETEVFSQIVNSTFSTAELSFELAIGLTGILCLWMGIMKIGEKGGAIRHLSWLVGPFFNRLFPEVPKDHPARGSMLMNFSANMLGLDNAATPMGLKAMDELQEINDKKDTASNAMIMFLVLNTSGLTLIPVAVMNYRAQFDSENPSDIFLPILIATFFATLVGLIAVSVKQKINLFDKVILAYIGTISAGIGLLIWYFSSLTPEALQTQSSILSNVILYGIICVFIFLGLRKKINVYDAFIEGAKDGFSIAIKIVPFLVAILVSIGVFRASGAMDYLIDGFQWFFALFFENVQWVNGLPTALMKSLSGSGARGMMLESFQNFGVDSFEGKLNATLQGATDTTFYIIAVYFGAVGIRKTRYAIQAGLLADLGGIVAGILVAIMFFGGETSTKPLSAEEIGNQLVLGISNQDKELIEPLLYDDCKLYDQTQDVKASNKKEVSGFFTDGNEWINPSFKLTSQNLDSELPMQSKESGDFDVIYLKYTSTEHEAKSNFILYTKNSKIKYIQYLDSF
ncbi:MAG: spore maturation protein [Crocinitomicaceae bacterium]|nr:spore maturation protein [Crocinitomicaceae bacterium]